MLDSSDEEISKKEAIAKRLVLTEFFFFTAMCMVIPVRAPMVLGMKKGDTVSTARIMGLMTSTAAFLELFINPALSQCSDIYGRKPFLILGPTLNCCLHATVSAFPTVLPVMFMNRVITGCCFNLFKASLSAVLSDLFEGPRLAQWLASQGSMFGLGLALGPFLGAKLRGDRCFFCSALCIALTGTYIASCVPETMKKDEHRKFSIGACSPVRFLKLFKTRALSTMATTVALQSCGDYLNVYDLNFLYLKTVLPGFGQQQIGNFASAVGSTMFLCGTIMRNAIQIVGQKSATLMANSAWATAMTLLGTAQNVPQVVASVFTMTFGHLRNSAVSAYVIKHGQSQGMGKAEIVGAQANLLALVKVMIPIFYGNLFAWATSKGRKSPGAPYLFIAGVTVLSQLCFWTCDPDKEPAKSM